MSESLRQRRKDPQGGGAPLDIPTSGKGTSAAAHGAGHTSHENSDASATMPSRDQVVWGKTPNGQVFRVPTTHDVLTLFNPAYPKSHIDLFNLFLLGFQIVLFFVLPPQVARVFFLVYFALWRAAYDVGLGWVLTRQSKKKWIVREMHRFGWLDETRRPKARAWIKKQLAGKMGKDYSFDDLPLEYNTWLLFRQAVDIILLNDFVAYCMFAFSCFRVPTDLSIWVHIMRWIGGIALIAFNLWVKTEAHNVVKDYGWYWGDVFFQRGNLIFDGVFELAPHPMYSVGYAGYYGLSLIVGSYPVLFVSLAAHAAQFGFLVFFENPHIERTYGQRKLLAARLPLGLQQQQQRLRTESGSIVESSVASSAETSPTRSNFSPIALKRDVAELPTPSVTEGESATETDELVTETETDTETELELVGDVNANANGGNKLRETGNGHDHSHKAHTAPNVGDASVPSNARRSGSGISGRDGTQTALSQHDLMNIYFRKETILFHNVDLLRASDLKLVLVVAYALLAAILPTFYTTAASQVAFHFAHALLWSVFHSFGLGLLLRAQSERKFLVRHFLKHYYYPQARDAGKAAVMEAFANWKSVYNLSMCMTYISFIGLSWRMYSIPHDWSVGHELLRHTLGVILIGIHIWATTESYEVLGMFGWFFGDFFMDDFPAHLEYSGIYRYLNNPEVISGAAFFGLSLISGSKLVFTLAVIRHLSQWWFLSKVEYPHMRKLYGDSLRNDAGFVKVIKKVAKKNAHLLETRAGRHAPKIRRVAKEVKGKFEKVYEDTADAVEEFLAKSRPRISEVVQETKVLQQLRERLVLPRVASDLDSYDSAKYIVSIAPSAKESLEFHLGEPIRVKWHAPANHSRKDWIGIYRVGATQSNFVTRTSSLGMWVPVHNEEWDGDIPLGLPGQGDPVADTNGDESEEGEVVFEKSALPWQTGKYEIRYHHDGKYNVMSLDGPLEVYVEKPEDLGFDSVRKSLMHIVPLCLDSDPSLIPLSCRDITPKSTPKPISHENNGSIDSSSVQETVQEGRDPDDFRFWSERQAKRISGAITQAFGVELKPEVIIADANLSALANRILISRELLTGVTHKD